MRTSYIFENRDGSQVWICIWPDGEVSMATRKDAQSTWGPRIEPVRTEVVE